MNSTVGKIEIMNSIILPKINFAINVDNKNNIVYNLDKQKETEERGKKNEERKSNNKNSK